jgi:hypothetical protein
VAVHVNLRAKKRSIEEVIVGAIKKIVVKCPKSEIVQAPKAFDLFFGHFFFTS